MLQSIPGSCYTWYHLYETTLIIKSKRITRNSMQGMTCVRHSRFQSSAANRTEAKHYSLGFTFPQFGPRFGFWLPHELWPSHTCLLHLMFGWESGKQKFCSMYGNVWQCLAMFANSDISDVLPLVFWLLFYLCTDSNRS